MGKATINAIRNLPRFQTTSKDSGPWDWTDGSNGGNYRWTLQGSFEDLDIYAKRVRRVPKDGRVPELSAIEIEFIETVDYSALRRLLDLKGLVCLKLGELNNNDEVFSTPVDGHYSFDFEDIKPRVFTNYFFGWVVTLHEV